LGKKGARETNGADELSTLIIEPKEKKEKVSNVNYQFFNYELRIRGRNCKINP